MLRSIIICAILLLSNSVLLAQKKDKAASTPQKPKLIVGLVVDQMRWDYLYRFNDRYGKGGFNRMLNQGFSFENTYIPYVPTYTAVGHATVYTGAVPATHGIVGNNWYDRKLGKNMYCTDDSTVQTVGGTGSVGKMSPANMWSTSIADELRLSSNFRSKVIGISLKDRGAILPAGHSANAAYWYNDADGKWVSSTYYMQQLPNWVNAFNAKDPVSEYLQQDWNTLYPIDTYVQSSSDDKPYEGGISGMDKVQFPYTLSTLTKGKYSAFKTTPHAASYTFDFAKEAIVNEALGKDAIPDLLAVSISSTDYIGHSFGPNSIEAEDAFLRLDKDIESFLNFLDKEVGKNNYLVFLSADHGVAHVPGFLKEHNIPAGTYNEKNMAMELNALVKEKFGIENIIVKSINYQFHLNRSVLEASGKAEEIKKFIIASLYNYDYVTTAFETAKAESATIPDRIRFMLKNGYSQQRSGDIQYITKPGYFYGGSKGTTHGFWSPYDAHIPFVLYGWGIPQGKSYREVYMSDIAPTLAAKLQIQKPSGAIGEALEEVF